MKKLLDFAVAAIGMTLFAVGVAFITIEWMAGCGESYTDAYGKIHINQCVFINFPPKDYK
jgi:branched-subunit amino acid permease